MTHGAPALRLRDVAFRRAGRAILEDVDWTVRCGERWAVLGPNGAGKSTLLLLAAAHEMPSQGCVEILGERVGAIDLRVLRRRIAYAGAPLNRRLPPDTTAVEAVASGRFAALRAFAQPLVADDWREARSLLADLGVAGVADQRLATLSEGERQRVQLARTFMVAAALHLLDEPTAGLDLAGRERLLARLAGSASHSDRTTVFVTHHVEEIPPGFTHTLLVRGGRVLAAGPLATTLTSENLSACFDLPLHVSHADGRFTARAPAC